ncbi:MAG: hypothetical protein U5L03_06920 [Burkholderiaceae bacterium]|nr:hypothetical protein [Burkholderiaceae bacterium]
MTDFQRTAGRSAEASELDASAVNHDETRCRLRRRRAVQWLVTACVILPLLACKPSAEQAERAAEQRRQHCLDNFCEGDVVPPHDQHTQTAFKRDGRWFVGPKEYGAGGAVVFYWPSKAPTLSEAAKGESPDGRIEVFIQRGTAGDHYENVRISEREGKILERDAARPGLVTYRVKRDPGDPNTYLLRVATEFTGMGQTHPTLFCTTKVNPACTTYLQWMPGIELYVRFEAKHGSDWPQIYSEIVRIVALIKEQ